MKDKVFIGWSGSNKAALEVKKLLEQNNSYVCSIGGNSDNNSQYSSVGDTVLQQIRECNQAIIIFQNRADGAVSNNLFFELGYVLSLYGQKKVHCVKRAHEQVVLPSDFDNSFVEAIDDSGVNGKTFEQGIVEYFIGRQKMSITDNKMYLINNRYILHDKIQSHYSETGSKCSDYELAQYIMFYMQAAHMFGDEKKILKEISDFKQAHHYDFSPELALAVNICLSFFDLVLNIQVEKETAEVFVEKKLFWRVKQDYTHYLNQIICDETGIFDEWAQTFIYEHLTYAHMLVSNNKSLTYEVRKSLKEEAITYGNITIEKINDLLKQAPSKENNDEIGLISLLKAYVYRNIFLAKQFLGAQDVFEWIDKTLKERESLKNNFSRGTIDTQLYNNFNMEYYLALVNYLSFNKNIDHFELEMYKDEIYDYLNSIKNDDSGNAFLKQIAYWYDCHCK